jgi:hypothetical protein
MLNWTFKASLGLILTTGLFSCRPKDASDLKDLANALSHSTSLDFRSSGDALTLMVAGSSYSWTKFVRMTDGRLWFQNANVYPYHFNFASAHIPEFRGLTNQEFDQKTLFNSGRIAQNGSILVNTQTKEIGIDLVAQDVLATNEAIAVLQAVREQFIFENGETFKTYYMPTGSQRQAASNDASIYDAEGFSLASVGIWEKGNACYARGWALGRLVNVPTADIDKEFAAGNLKTTDILLTDDVPAEIPMVAGIISRQPATRNSHVAILAQSYGIPFVHFRSPKDVAQLDSLKGKEVYLASGKENFCQTALFAASFPQALKEKIIGWKGVKALVVPGMNTQATLIKSVSKLNTTDTANYGGKSSNFSSLIRSVPNNTNLEAHAMSFQAWSRFVSVRLNSGKTLGEEIELRLSKVVDFSLPKEKRFPPKDIAAVKTTLADIRRLVEKTKMPSDLRQEIVSGLAAAGFSATQPIRFRSSTNVEDSDQFTGAGLYESKSGCLGDDQSPPSSGSQCDQSATKPKPTIDAIQKVFASFYNDNAYLERLRRQVDESVVGMGILVHYSSPDQFELANAVATVTVDENLMYEATLVSQIGAESVTNPTPGNEPEVVQAMFFADQNDPSKIDLDAISDPILKEKSGKLRQGDWVFGSSPETKTMIHLIFKAVEGFANEKKLKKPYTADLEVKKQTVNGSPKLVIKQIRPVPKPSEEFKGQNVILPDEREMCPLMSGSSGPTENKEFQRYADLQAKIRVKLKAGILNDLRKTGVVEWISGTKSAKGVNVTFDTKVRNLKGRVVSNAKDQVVERWSIPEFGKDIKVNIVPQIDGAVDSGGPIFSSLQWFDSATIGSTSDGTPLQMSVSWLTGANRLNYIDCQLIAEQVKTGAPDFTTPQSGPGGFKISRSVKRSNGHVFKGEAYIAGFFGAKIEGIGSSIIELKSPFAFTYAATHHNFDEWYFYEPFKDPNVTTAQRDALRQVNIISIIDEFSLADGHKRFVFGTNGKLRQLQ